MRLTAGELALLALLVALLALLVALPALALGLALWSQGELARQLLLAALERRAALVGGVWLAALAALGAGLWWGYRRYPLAARGLAEALEMALAGGELRPPELVGELARLAALIARQLAQAKAVDARVASASAELSAERQRLAALVAELPQGVVVCSWSGQVLLYNARAQALLASEALGLGRSIFAVVERSRIAHALARLQIARAQRAVSFSAPLGGRQLQLRLSPVGGEREGLAGFVLIVDDVTERARSEDSREAQLGALIERSRARLANIRAAAEALAHVEAEADARARFTEVICQEAAAFSGELESAACQLLVRAEPRWAFDRIPASDLLEALADYVETRLGTSPGLERSERALWLVADSYALTRALGYLIDRLEGELGAQGFWLRLARHDAYAELELLWPGAPLAAEALAAWESAPLAEGFSVRAVIERHGGALWAERQRPALKLLLPLVEAPAGEAPPLSLQVHESRPVFYDFDLFARPLAAELAAQPLRALSYTVFDLETTGLAPSEGDEIVAIGAVRIVNGRLVPNEAFEQLVDPQRPLSAASVAVHGLSEALLRGQPTIAAVLPRFARFVGDSVLVAHNAAFDLRFLQLKEQHTGVRLRNPVLDTLLLAAALWPGCPSYDLEALAARCEVPIIGRHTALGDAFVTAEVFLKLLALLSERGVTTLGAAQRLAQQSRLAQLRY